MPNELPPGQEPDTTTPETQPLNLSAGHAVINVNGELLTPDHGLELLRRVLSEGRDYIYEVIEQGYKRSKESFPDYDDILPPPIVVMLLGARDKEVLTEEGYYAGSNPYTDREALREQFKPFWDVVEESGFVPDIWATGTRSGRTIYLRARRPDVPPSGVSYDPE